MKKCIAFFLAAFIMLNPLFSEEEDGYSSLVPEEYSDDEFHPFLRDLRRAEVIFVGSYPFSILFTKIGIDMYTYAASGFSQSSAPALFGGTARESRDSDETVKLLVSALYVSAAITAADYIIGRIRVLKSDENN